MFLQLQEGAELLKMEESRLQKRGANEIELLLWKVQNICIVTAVGKPGSKHTALSLILFHPFFKKEELLLGAISVVILAGT